MSAKRRLPSICDQARLNFGRPFDNVKPVKELNQWP